MEIIDYKIMKNILLSDEPFLMVIIKNTRFSKVVK